MSRPHYKQKTTMEYFALICSLSLLAAMVLCLELGRRYALKMDAEASEAASAGKRIVEGGFFALMSLLIAFNFSGAVGRFDNRRALIVEEANTIGQTYMKIDLLPPEAQPQMRDLFRAYLDERLALFRAIPDMDAVNAHIVHSAEIQNQMWQLGITATRGQGGHPNAGIMTINGLTSLVDVANKRNWGALTHPPLVIYVLLFAVALICAFIAGGSLASAKTRSWSHVLGFAVLTCVSVYVILEIEFPRIGFIGIDKYDQALVDVRTNMK